MAGDAGLDRPGRLGDPCCTVGTDPRTHAGVLGFLTALKLTDFFPPAGTLTVDSDEAVKHAFFVQQEAELPLLHKAVLAGCPPVEGVTSSARTITGVDGNDIELLITSPEGEADPTRPCILHLHGGAMVNFSAKDPNYTRFRELLAAQGCVVVGVEFRNAGGARGSHPFPAGLNDCVAAAEWARGALATELRAAKIVLCGESGGANLAIALALKAKRDGRPDLVDGVAALCPYIYGDYRRPPPELPSLVENDGYMVSTAVHAARASLYDPTGAHTCNPLAWPYFATAEELAGLPPHLVSVNELDPHRDEGLQYFRRLSAAGVDATARVVAGTVHAWEIMGLDAVAPSITRATLREIVGFARAL